MGLEVTAESPEVHSSADQPHEKVLLRQYKLFNETVLQANSYISNDFVYATGINGFIYRMSKRDLARLVHRHKEKLKGNLAKKLVQIRRQQKPEALTEEVCLDFSDNILEDPEERYLYSGNDSAISSFSVSNDECNGLNFESPLGCKRLAQKELGTHSPPVYQQLEPIPVVPHFIALSLRNSDLLLVLGLERPR